MTFSVAMKGAYSETLNGITVCFYGYRYIFNKPFDVLWRGIKHVVGRNCQSKYWWLV